MGRIDNKTVFPVSHQLGIGLWMSGVIAAAFLYVPPADKFVSPGCARILIFHMPCAMIAVTAYIVSTIYAVMCLARGEIASDIKSAASASMGLLFTMLATVTGMIFAKVEWGRHGTGTRGKPRF